MVEFRIDQSGKWEGSRDTALGVEGPHSFSVIVRHREKERLAKFLAVSKKRFAWKEKDLTLRLFAYVIFLALRDAYRAGDVITLDTEYDGQDGRLQDLLVTLFDQQRRLRISHADVRFERLGKGCLAHNLAISTLQGKRRAMVEFTAEDFAKLFVKV